MPLTNVAVAFNPALHMLTSRLNRVGEQVGGMTATVGDDATATLAVDVETIERYAALVGDDNPLHTDPEYAEGTMLEGRVAHGMLSGGVISAALADLPGDVVYLSQDLEFTAPVRPDQVVVARAEVVENLGEGKVRVRTVAHAADDEAAAHEAVAADDPDTRVIVGEATVLSTPCETPPRAD
jgi:3-hydroxybutyryl-CoA dehydratase